MKRFILTCLISAISLLITSHFIDGFYLEGFKEAAIASLLLGLLNATIRPVLSFLTFPIRLLTFGLFSFVINALMVWGVSILVTPGFTISGPVPAVLGSLVLTGVASVLNLVFNPKKR